MIMRATPGYRDLFGGEASVEGLLAGIPSDIVIKIVSWLNAQFLHASAPIERDRELRKDVSFPKVRPFITGGEVILGPAGPRITSAGQGLLSTPSSHEKEQVHRTSDHRHPQAA